MWRVRLDERLDVQKVMTKYWVVGVLNVFCWQSRSNLKKENQRKTTTKNQRKTNGKPTKSNEKHRKQGKPTKNNRKPKKNQRKPKNNFFFFIFYHFFLARGRPRYLWTASLKHIQTNKKTKIAKKAKKHKTKRNLACSSYAFLFKGGVRGVRSPSVRPVPSVGSRGAWSGASLAKLNLPEYSA